MTDERMTYADVGVNYDAMDPFKRMAQLRARLTDGNILRLNNGAYRAVEASRGESVFLIETPWGYLAHVDEGLGTKNRIVDTASSDIAVSMYRITGKSFYDQLARCTVGCTVNDMITLGALPLSLSMHLKVGDSKWFEDEHRSRELVDGWVQACNLARCVWGCGETPTLQDVPYPLLSASAVGIIEPKSRLIQPNGAAIRGGDAIMLLGSSGIHANGLTLARKIAEKLPEGYATPIGDGRMYGEALLDPTVIYVGLVEDCLNAGVEIHYAINITGHGWRKLMRAQGNFVYEILDLPPRPPIFDSIAEYGPVDDREMFGNFNMGAGFALIMPFKEVDKFEQVLESYNHGPQPIKAYRAGLVWDMADKKVVIRPLGLEYAADTLGVR